MKRYIFKTNGVDVPCIIDGDAFPGLRFAPIWVYELRSFRADGSLQHFATGSIWLALSLLFNG